LTRSIDLGLPDAERRRAASLATRWNDLLYAPGPGFADPLEPGIYRASFVITPVDGPAVRVTSLVVPAFGGELCRIRLEPLVVPRPETLGSFFDPARRGVVHALSGDRTSGSARPPEPGWSYDGPSLRPRLERVSRPRLVRERVAGGAGDGAFSWTVDRGLVLTGADGVDCLFLAVPDVSEHAVFAPAPGLYRALLDPTAPATPGAGSRDLLGYGDDTTLGVNVQIEPL